MTNEELNALLQAIGELGMFEDAMGLNQMQLALAEKGRSTPMPKMQQAGDLLLAPSPLAYIGPTIDRIRGGQQSADVQKAIAGLLNRGAGNIGAMAKAHLAERDAIKGARQGWLGAPELLRRPGGPDYGEP